MRTAGSTASRSAGSMKTESHLFKGLPATRIAIFLHFPGWLVNRSRRCAGRLGLAGTFLERCGSAGKASGGERLGQSGSGDFKKRGGRVDRELSARRQPSSGAAS